VKATSVSATGYTAGEPTGRYMAFANSPACLETVTGYGDCGIQSLIVTGPLVSRVDVTFAKRFPIAKTVYGEIQMMVFNLFNRTNFNPINYVGPVYDSYQVTSAVDASRTGQLAFRLSF